MTEQPRQWRVYHTHAVVVAFARYAVSISTIARALVLPEPVVRTMCLRAVREGDLKAMPPEVTELRGDYLREVLHLRSKIEDLQETIREMGRGRLADYTDFIGVGGLTKHEARIVAALVATLRISKERMYFAVYGNEPEDEQPEPKIIDVFVCKIRKKLAPAGVSIDTIWGIGYEITPENRNKLLALAGREPVQEAA